MTNGKKQVENRYLLVERVTSHIDTGTWLNYLFSSEVRIVSISYFILRPSGRNSMVECQLPKLKVASSSLVARSISPQ
jgi:hypothetical protein